MEKIGVMLYLYKVTKDCTSCASKTNKFIVNDHWLYTAQREHFETKNSFLVASSCFSLAVGQNPYTSRFIYLYLTES